MLTSDPILARAYALTIKSFDITRTTEERAEWRLEAMLLLAMMAGA